MSSPCNSARLGRRGFGAAWPAYRKPVLSVFHPTDPARRPAGQCRRSALLFRRRNGGRAVAARPRAGRHGAASGQGGFRWPWRLLGALVRRADRGRNRRHGLRRADRPVRRGRRGLHLPRLQRTRIGRRGHRRLVFPAGACRPDPVLQHSPGQSIFAAGDRTPWTAPDRPQLEHPLGAKRGGSARLSLNNFSFERADRRYRFLNRLTRMLRAKIRKSLPWGAS